MLFFQLSWSDQLIGMSIFKNKYNKTIDGSLKSRDLFFLFLFLFTPSTTEGRPFHICRVIDYSERIDQNIFMFKLLIYIFYFVNTNKNI